MAKKLEGVSLERLYLGTYVGRYVQCVSFMVCEVTQLRVWLVKCLYPESDPVLQNRIHNQKQ